MTVHLEILHEGMQLFLLLRSVNACVQKEVLNSGFLPVVPYL